MTSLRRAVPSLIALALLLLPAPAVRAEDWIHHEWAILRIGGSPAGYLHTSVRKTGPETAPLYETEVDTRMSMRRLGAGVSIESWQRTIEKEGGQFVSLSSRMKMSGQETTVEVTFEGNKARIVTTLMGTSRESTVDCPPETVGPYRAQLIGKEKGLAAGTSFEVKSFAAETSGPVTVTTTVVGPEEVELLDGRKETLVKQQSFSDALPVLATSWVGPDGVPRKTLIPIAGFTIEFFTTDEATALAAMGGDKTQSPEVFTSSLVVSPHFVPRPRHLDEAVLRVSPVNPAVKLPELADSRQVVDSREADGSLRLRIRRSVPPAGKTGTRPIASAPADLADFLSANSMIQCDSPDIRKIAEEVVGREKDAWKAAVELERWVYDNVTEKSFDVAFASALEVCRDRAGDCSEHAVLLCALCRAAGIPARVDMGLEYIGGIWGGHAWNQVWIDGTWYALDGTNGFGFVDPLHLTMSRMSLKDGSFAKDFLGIITGLGNIKIEVLEAAEGGHSFKPAERPTQPNADGRYVDGIFGLAFTTPPGFEVQFKGPQKKIGFEILEIERDTRGRPNLQIEVSALDAPRVLDWASLLRRNKLDGPPKITELTVDGRPARLGVSSKNPNERALFVHDAETVFVFILQRAQNDADVAVFDEFLKTIDLDVPSRN